MKPPKISTLAHLAVLQKFVYRLTGDITEETRKRLNILISIYKRMYA